MNDTSALPIDLTLSFDTSPAGAALRWQADVLGARASELRLPLADADHALLLRALDVLQDPDYPLGWTAAQQSLFAFSEGERATLARIGLWDDAGHVRRDAPRRVGRLLYAAITADPRGAQALGTLRDHAAALGRPLALSLCFPPEAASLAVLPWELLWDDGATPLLLSRGATARCTRHLSLPTALPPPRPADAGPLRILAVAPHAGIGPELRQIERAARRAAWAPLVDGGLASVHEVSPASRAALLGHLERAEQPDVVHFFGHGRCEGGEGALLLDGPSGGEWVPAGVLATLLGGARLVALHACHGAAVDAAAPLGGLAAALSAAGVPLVLAMQCSLRITAAMRLGRAVYEALARGASVQAAVGDARRALFVEEPDGASWFVPALYVRSRDAGPAYLRLPEPAATLAAEAPRGPRQSVVARGGGIVRGASLHGAGSATQAVEADTRGQIANTRLRARGDAQQSVAASDGGAVEDAELDDTA
jgi:hypothetical protein